MADTEHDFNDVPVGTILGLPADYELGDVWVRVDQETVKLDVDEYPELFDLYKKAGVSFSEEEPYIVLPNLSNSMDDKVQMVIKVKHE